MKLCHRFAAGWVLAAMAFGCAAEGTGDGLGPTKLEAEVSERIPTVVHIRWATEQESRGYVEYGNTEALGQRTNETEPGHDHEVSLLGLEADADTFFRVVTTTGDGAESDVAEVHTGDLPNSLPYLEQEGTPHDWFTIVPLIGRTTAVSILDGSGKLVWYTEDERELDVYRARLTRDGRSIVYNAASVSGDPAEDSELVTVSLDGKSRSSIAVPLLAHDFVELPEGGYAAIAVEYGPLGGDGPGAATELRGNRIVEISEDGDVETVWTTWDCFDPAEVAGEDIDIAWSNANALDYDESEDAYLLGMRNFSSITKISRATFDCEWVIGTFGATIDFAEGSEVFLHQHQFELSGDRLIVLDNDGSIATESRVLEYQLDFESGVATQTWQYVADPPVYTFVLGEPTWLDDGGAFVNWSAAGQLDLVDEDGDAQWKVNLPAGFIFGFHTLEKSLYPTRTRLNGGPN